MPDQDPPQVTVIIPTLNNFPDITATLDLVRDALADHTFETLVMVSDRVDGPALRDVRTYALNHDARVHPHALRSDKATAVREGFRRARGQIIGYIDADAGWEAAPAHLRQIVSVVSTGRADCAAAERDQDHWSRLRRAKTSLFAIAARALFDLPIRDTQAPMKFFTRPAADLLTEHAAWRGWEFDVDLLWTLHITGHHIQPVPVTWKSNGGETGWVTVLLLATMAPGMIWNLALLKLTARRRRSRILLRHVNQT